MKMSPVTLEARLDPQDDRYHRLLGQYINELRIRRGMSQAVLAKASGLSRTEIHNIERGRTSEKVATIRRVCMVLKLPFGELVVHIDYLMDHPECEPQEKRLKTLRGFKM